MTDRPKHLVRATDLGQVDGAHFPTEGKTLVYSQSEDIRAFDDANARQLTFADFVAKD